MNNYRRFYALLLLLTFHLAASLSGGAQTQDVSFQARRDFLPLAVPVALLPVTFAATDRKT
jgi:hypothetical protein